MFDHLPVLRHLVQTQLLNRKQRNERRAERIEVGSADVAAASGREGHTRPVPDTGDLVLLWTVSNLTNKPGM